MHQPHIFREYDIRGRYGIDFDEEFAFALGKGFVSFCKEHFEVNQISIALGKDARHSSTPLVEALAKGLMEQGAQVYHLGLVTSPVTYFSCFHIKELTGAIMITGSHNPPDYNGFKISLGTHTLSSKEIQALKSHVEAEHTYLEGGSSKNYDIVTPYVNRLAQEFDFSDVPFVVDCGNGAAGSVARKVYEACGLTPDILFEKPNGDFPNHHPDPTLEENLVDLKNHLRASEAQFGIGYDGDADRIVVVTKEGRTIFADELMSLYAKFVLRDHPGAKIVGDVKCSSEYYKLLSQWGAEPVMWKTGHSLIKRKVKELNSPFGGEFSGHIFFNDRFYGFDDAIYCSLRLIEILKSSGQNLEELLSYYPTTFCSPEIRIEVGEEKKHQLVEKYKSTMLARGEQVNDLDGARVTFSDGWALVRVSNTQPSVTLRFEAQSEQKLNEIQQEAVGLLNL